MVLLKDLDSRQCGFKRISCLVEQSAIEVGKNDKAVAGRSEIFHQNALGKFILLAKPCQI